MKSFKDKVAVITGAGSGMGRYLAVLLAKEGAHLTICDVDQETLDETKEMLRKYNVSVSSLILDVADKEAVEALPQKVLDDHRPVELKEPVGYSTDSAALNIVYVDHKASHAERISRKSSVQVHHPDFRGFGSGTYFKIKDRHFILMATKNGVVKKTALTAFEKKYAPGLKAINLDEGDRLIGTIITDGKDEVCLASRSGKAIRFKETDVRPMGRSTTVSYTHLTLPTKA